MVNWASRNLLVGNNEPPVNFWDFNQCYAAKRGTYVVKANPRQGHDYWSLFEGFIGWSIAKSIFTAEYSAHYIVKDFFAIGLDPTYDFNDNDVTSEVSSVGQNAFDFFFINCGGQDLAYGFKYSGSSTSTKNLPIDPGFVIVDSALENVAIETELTNDQGDPARLIVYPTMGDIPGNALSVSNLNEDDTDGLGAHTWASNVSDGIRDNWDIRKDSIDLAAQDGETFTVERSATQEILRKYGYYEVSGVPTMFRPTWITETSTGRDHEVLSLEVALTSMDSSSTLGDYTNHGAWSDVAGPSRADITTSTTEATPIDINVITEGAGTTTNRQTPVLVSTDRTPYAECVAEPDSNVITYQPDFGFTGTDSFDCWITDKGGGFTKVNVTVTVT
jgi:hypothetical protein